MATRSSRHCVPPRSSGSGSAERRRARDRRDAHHRQGTRVRAPDLVARRARRRPAGLADRLARARLRARPRHTRDDELHDRSRSTGRADSRGAPRRDGRGVPARARARLGCLGRAARTNAPAIARSSGRSGRVIEATAAQATTSRMSTASPPASDAPSSHPRRRSCWAARRCRGRAAAASTPRSCTRAGARRSSGAHRASPSAPARCRPDPGAARLRGDRQGPPPARPVVGGAERPSAKLTGRVSGTH